MPSYRLHDQDMLCFAGSKKHVSLYAANERVVAQFKNELAPYEFSKDTIRASRSSALTKLLSGR